MDPTASSATELVAAVRGRRLTAHAVVRAFLDRTERLEPVLNTCVTACADAALQAAGAVDRAIARGDDPGALAGLPVSVKDLIAAGGVRQTFGSRLWADHVAAEDAPAVARLRAAGACIVGKTTTSELGGKAVGDSPLTGVTRNPWNPQHTPGGSSAGAAAGVAARLVPAALGTDGGGSLRIPGAFCGLVGLKATFGRVPVWPASATPSLAHVGPLTHDVGDAALLLSVIAGHDPRDPASLREAVPDFAGAARGGASGLRIGWIGDIGYGRADLAIRDLCREAAFRLLGEGATVRTLGPLFTRDPAPAWNALFYAAIGRRLAQVGPWDTIAGAIDPALRGAVERACAHAPGDEAVRHLQAVTTAAVDAALGQVDVLAMPTVPVTAPPTGVDVPEGHLGRNAVDWSYFTYPFNLTGHPALSLPVGLADDGLPVGLQLVAAHGDEVSLLRAAGALERAQPFTHRPGLFP